MDITKTKKENTIMSSDIMTWLPYAGTACASGLVWLGRLVWMNHTDLQALKLDYAKNGVTFQVLGKELDKCRESNREAYSRIETNISDLSNKVDRLIERERK